nr:hypothetical protein CFP56_70121 [Quercus suber]
MLRILSAQEKGNSGPSKYSTRSLNHWRILVIKWLATKGLTCRRSRHMIQGIGEFRWQSEDHSRLERKMGSALEFAILVRWHCSLARPRKRPQVKSW